MVTSNKQPEKKVVKMEEHNSSAVVPQRTLLGEVNEHITCPLCRGYYIDATTIVECLHSFCRSCIIKHLKAKSYCPVCEMMINSAKPNIKLDKALQDIVYKLVPGLFQKEMERRQTFYASRPGPAASATPEQRGEDTERIIFSPEDVISFSLEYSDATDTDSISSKSSDSNEPPSTPATNRRYLQCPAVVNISHLKKFLSMKFDIDSTQFAIDILYKRVPLPDYYTLMDIAYIYNWKRNEPMRFFYQIIDYIAIRNRIFDINRKSTPNNKASPALTDETSTSRPTPDIKDQASEASSGTDSPMLEENSTKQSNKKDDKGPEQSNMDKNPSILKKNDDEVEKSQFLNSFELTAKSNCSLKSSPEKSGTEPSSNESLSKTPPKSPLKVEEKPETLKRKFTAPQNAPELKKLKIEIEKTKLTNTLKNTAGGSSSGNNNSAASQQNKPNDSKPKVKEPVVIKKTEPSSNTNKTLTTPLSNKDSKQQTFSNSPMPTTDISGLKRPVMSQQGVATPKRKPETSTSIQPPGQKTVSPLKIPVPKLDSQQAAQKPSESALKPLPKKMPDLKPSVPTTQSLQNKLPLVNKVRMDLLANNSDPTIDRSKILSQVKTSLSAQNTSPSGDPLKSLLDTCKINIPSSLSITLTDQKLDPRSVGEQVANDQKKNVVNKNLATASNTLSHKVPSPPVHNYIEILKLPDNDANKKPNKSEGGTESKNSQPKNEANSSQPKPANKSSETSAKGPIPNLKPIADTKLSKQQQAANYSGSPITFQQTFEQQIQTLQTDKKPKLPKNKAQVPKLVPATPKSLSAANKPNPLINKPNTTTTDIKTGAALDLSSPHNVQTQSGNQTFDKAFETMQTIANLAKKQSLSAKGLSPSMSQNTSFPGMSSRPLNTGISPVRIPGSNTMNQMKHEKTVSSGSQLSNRQEPLNKPNPGKSSNSSSPTTLSPSYQMPSHPSLGSTQPSPRQNRSPSSSPKLVIAEEKQGGSTSSEHNVNQSNQITSTQLTSTNPPKPETLAMPGPSKLSLKSLKSMTPTGKLPSRQPITPNIKTNTPSIPNSPDYLQPQFIAQHQHALMRRQMEMNAAWLKAQRQYDFDIFKNMSNMAHQGQNDFTKDKQ